MRIHDQVVRGGLQTTASRGKKSDVAEAQGEAQQPVGRGAGHTAGDPLFRSAAVL